LNPGEDTIVKYLLNTDRFLFPVLLIAPAPSIYWAFFFGEFFHPYDSIACKSAFPTKD